MRSKQAPRREVQPDAKYNSLEVAKIINRAMTRGKKTVAEKQVYNALEIIAEKSKKDPIEVLKLALDNIKPKMEVRSRRVGGAAYQVPMPVTPRRQFSLSVRWLVEVANKRPNSAHHTFADKLASEILDASKGEGGTIKKRDDTHKMADANKAFAHFRW